ncbi:meiotic recombination protein REC8 homolog [Scomber scombrus]|uniref:meiotic recombination protein REC8 homolog n=1 Tax=Scomber scombrus TaxID=13677 RepID=UPI002DD981D2|nr:meiotic recombination protein REC8 homolog [Scomber scombrus]
MFYYPTVLRRHTGCFSTIWLVATKGIRIPRRDILKVNVISTCDDILDYVLEQVPPPAPGLPRPRFSLYLSSQLQYGIIVVYHRQCAILLEELQSTIGQLLKQRTGQKIDMDDYSKQTLLLPDAPSVLEEAEGAIDPLFGVMYMQDIIPSPTAPIKMGGKYLREASPELSELTPPTTLHIKMEPNYNMPRDVQYVRLCAVIRAEVPTAITASPDSITLRETEPVVIPTAEFEGAELADHHPDTIDFLMAQTDDFPEDLETAREEMTETDKERGQRELAGSTLELQPTTPSSEDATVLPQEEPRLSVEKPGPPEDQLSPVPVPSLPSPPSLAEERIERSLELEPTTLSSEDAILLPQEEPQLSVEKPGPPEDQLTPIPVPPLPSPPSLAEERIERSLELEVPAFVFERHFRKLILDVPLPEVTARRGGRKRQLIFFDPETQIPEDVLQQQIDNPLTQTMRPLCPLPASHRRLPAAELLRNPCTCLPEEVMFLWRQAATISPLSGSDLQVGERGPESTDSEKEKEAEMVEMMAEREERRQLSPKEVPRDVSESEMFCISGHDSLPLEGSDQREASQEISPKYPSEREGSTVSRSTLQDIPEVMEDMPSRASAESLGLMPVLPEHEVAPVVFQSLLPPDADRRAVSNIFHTLLVTLSSRKVRAEQDQPYGDILILPGPNWEEGDLAL